MQLKLDLHVHSHFSADSVITPKELLFHAKKRGLNGVAITDHDRINGALKIAKEIELFIIPGIEVSSQKGHIVGLGVRECISSRLSVDETVDRIHEAGGLAVACHPGALVKGGLGKHVTFRFDAVETINASAVPFKRSIRLSQQLASQAGISSSVGGSDAHYASEIGYAYTMVDAEEEIGEVTKAIKAGLCKPFGEAIPITMRLKRRYLTTLKKIGIPRSTDDPRI